MSETRKQLLLLGARPLQERLESWGYSTLHYAGTKELLAEAPEVGARACIASLELVPAEELPQFIRRLRSVIPFMDVVGWAPGATPEKVRSALQAGLKDIVLHVDSQDLRERLQRVIARQQFLPRLLEHRGRAETWRFEGLLSRDSAMHSIFDTVVRTAPTDATVLVMGETGTGKELLARAFHNRSEREGPMVALNCAAVPENLIDSELFGNEKGAFTGATSPRDGLFRHAEGGTLLLDEIGSIPEPVQNRLLRVLQEGAVRPVGGQREVPVDVRIIAATSQHLDTLVGEGRFREDLLYRLDVIRIQIPPLRERPMDVIYLFSVFMSNLSSSYKLQRHEVSDSFLDALQTYDWPGNVRQLENFAERVLLTVPSSERLKAEHFRKYVMPMSEHENATDSAPRTPASNFPQPDPKLPLPRALQMAQASLEKSFLHQALKANRGAIGESALQLGISRRTLQRKMQRYGLQRQAYRPDR